MCKLSRHTILNFHPTFDKVVSNKKSNVDYHDFPDKVANLLMNSLFFRFFEVTILVIENVKAVEQFIDMVTRIPEDSFGEFKAGRHDIKTLSLDIQTPSLTEAVKAFTLGKQLKTQFGIDVKF